MSSNVSFCSRCGWTDGEVNEETRLLMQSRRLRDRLYHLRMSSYAAIALFIGAVVWAWLESNGFQNRPSGGPFLLMLISVFAYFGLRVLQFQKRREQKALRKKAAELR